MYPKDLRYTKDHEWARLMPDGVAVIGISEFAQSELGDVVFVDLPAIGKRYGQFEKFGEIESVKTVSDLFLPLAGEVIEVNPKLKDSPEVVNQDPHGDGWMVRIKVKDAGQASMLLSSEDYERLIAQRGVH